MPDPLPSGTRQRLRADRQERPVQHAPPPPYGRQQWRGGWGAMRKSNTCSVRRLAHARGISPSQTQHSAATGVPILRRPPSDLGPTRCLLSCFTAGGARRSTEPFPLGGGATPPSRATIEPHGVVVSRRWRNMRLRLGNVEPQNEQQCSLAPDSNTGLPPRILPATSAPKLQVFALSSTSRLSGGASNRRRRLSAAAKQPASRSQLLVSSSASACNTAAGSRLNPPSVLAWYT
eukprot:scaffold6520_cov32-Tisochrysis_lutea.AAC.1